MLGFELIQVALGARDKLSHVPTEKEWTEAYAFAEKQSLIGICYAGVSRLPKEQLPDIDLLMEWIGQAEYIKTQNEDKNEKCRMLCDRLRNDGFWCCILKGQSNHINYGRLSDYRTSGDIDVWVMDSTNSPSVEKVVEYVKSENRIDGKEDEAEVVYHHVDWRFKGIPVELHVRPSWMYNPVTNRRLQRWCLGIETANYNGFPVPTNRFNAVYQLVHIYRHLFNEGIGLRQLLDYYFVLGKSRDYKEESMEVIKSLGMGRFCGAVMWIIQTVFDGSENWMLCPPNEKYGRFLLEEIMKAGNFGKYDKRLTYDRTNTIERGWGRMKRMSRLICFGPWEVLCAPGWKVWHYLWRKCHA